MIYLRMDDVGASSKQFEVYSKKRLGNLFFLKRTRRYGAWGPYPELTVEDWLRIRDCLEENNAFLTVGVTASWVEENGSLTPFPEKYEKQAEFLKLLEIEGRIEIANHGLTHCVVGKHLPRALSSNRPFHREFWDYLPIELHMEHLATSQKIFMDWLGKAPETLIPPGNVYSEKTIAAAERYGIKQINSSIAKKNDTSVTVTDLTNVIAFHDRELVLEGVRWLEARIKDNPNSSSFDLIKNKL